VREFIQSMAIEKTIILTTHNMDEADRLADRVAIIDHGELLVLDSPDVLKQQVGEGDVLEIYLAYDDIVLFESEIVTKLHSIKEEMQVEISGSMLIVRALDVVNLLPLILESLRSMNFIIGEVRLRPNTLEDVFIQLTGRRLRE
jgi:ABC-2 type transport system ATP-binding protein